VKGIEIHSRLKAALGLQQAPALEGLVAGTGQAEVTGIAVCYAPSLAVIEGAVAKGCNLIVAEAHPYYAYDPEWTGPGSIKVLESAPMVVAKKALIERTGVTVIRIKTGWDTAMPAAASRAWARSLDLAPAPESSGMPDYAMAHVRPTTMDGLARGFVARGLSGIRTIGKLDTPIAAVAVAAGVLTVPRLARILSNPRVDAVVAGDVCEWEAGPYMEDAIAAGRRAAMILLGQTLSSEAAVPAITEWIGRAITEVRAVPIIEELKIWTAGAAA
jgi:putative NIF3 family GTP cyclohydrolase 1 type 2